MKKKENLIDKIRDHCHLTGSHRGPAHSKNNNNVTQKQGNFYQLYFTVSVIIIVY